jgi:hypothetical protein
VRHLADIHHWCDDVTGSSGTARFARRPLLRAAVLGLRHEPDFPLTPMADGDAGHRQKGPVYAVTGTVLDAGPHVLVLGTARGEERFLLTASARAWRGAPVPPTALRRGDQVVARRGIPGGPAVDRIWAQAGRVTGMIIERDGPAMLLVDQGPPRGHRIVVIGAEAAGRIQVRFPRLEPGYLIDVIGLRFDGFLHGLIPATSQPPYLAEHPPAPPLVSGHVPDPAGGSAVWHEPGEEPEDLLGLAYPALDPETGCEHSAGPVPPACSRGRHAADRHGVDSYAADPHAAGPGCVRLPYLSVGSLVRVRNNCTARTRLLPVTGCGATARLFCDRCVACGTSRKGRIADLTMASFVELGGDLELGCFDATVTIGG